MSSAGMSRFARYAIAIAVATTLVGCAHGPVVSPDVIAELPAEARRLVYERENEVVIALARLDDARATLADRDAELAAHTPAKATAVTGARTKWLQGKREYAVAQTRAATLAVTCARGALTATELDLAARFHLVRNDARLAQWQAFERDCNTRLSAAHEAADTVATRVARAKKTWRQARTAYVKQTKDYDHGLWID